MERKNIKTLVQLLLHINQRSRISGFLMRESFSLSDAEIYQVTEAPRLLSRLFCENSHGEVLRRYRTLHRVLLRFVSVTVDS